jgi:hypothetical protein
MSALQQRRQQFEAKGDESFPYRAYRRKIDTGEVDERYRKRFSYIGVISIFPPCRLDIFKYLLKY